MQIFINVLLRTTIFFVVGLSFYLKYSINNFFDFSQAALIAFGAYLLQLLCVVFGFPLTLSLLASFILIGLIGSLTHLAIFHPLLKKNTPGWIILVASIGAYVIYQNIISLIWGNGAISLDYQNNIRYHIFNAYITKTQFFSICTTITLFLLFYFVIKKTKYGKQFKAISSNSELSSILGINSKRISLLTVFISSGIAAIGGYMHAFATDFTPTFGFNVLLYGVVAMIIGGIGSIRGLLGGSLLLATAQQLGAYYIGSKWMDTIAYILLILFLLWRPLGFSGKQLKKAEL